MKVTRSLRNQVMGFLQVAMNIYYCPQMKEELGVCSESVQIWYDVWKVVTSRLLCSYGRGE